MQYAIAVFDVPYLETLGPSERLKNTLKLLKEGAGSDTSIRFLAGNCLVLPLADRLPTLVRLLCEAQDIRVQYHVLFVEGSPSFCLPWWFPVARVLLLAGFIGGLILLASIGLTGW